MDGAKPDNEIEGVDPDDGVDPDEGVPDEDEGVDGAQADGAADGPVGAEPTSPPDMNHVPPPDGTQPDPADATVSDDAQSPPDPGGDAQAQADADSEKSGGGGSDGCHSVPGALALFWLPIVARRRRR